MARIIVASCMVRCPLGGLLSYVLQFLKGFELLGHDIFYFEKADYENACYDPGTDTKGNSGTFGTQSVQALLETYGLKNRWAFIDCAGQCHGLPRKTVKNIFRTADIFMDMGSFGSGNWMEEADQVPVRVLYEGEPGYTQIRMQQRRNVGEDVDEYDYYYTVGRQIGTDASSAPTAGQPWGHLWAVVATELFENSPPPPNGPFTSVMTWQSHKPIEFEGVSYGQKDIEFEKFMHLPERVDVPMEVRVTGSNVPRDRLQQCGWRMPREQTVTQSVKDYYAYIQQSAGEFSVAKNVFVKTRSGWLGDRSGTYLACGRPVVLQDTGFSNHLPCGEGLFAVNNEDEAEAAIRTIRTDCTRHAAAARRIAEEHLDAKRCLRRFLSEIS